MNQKKKKRNIIFGKTEGRDNQKRCHVGVIVNLIHMSLFLEFICYFSSLYFTLSIHYSNMHKIRNDDTTLTCTSLRQVVSSCGDQGIKHE